MADAHPSDQPGDRAGIEHVPDHTVRLALEESTLGTAGDDATGILAPMLEERKPFDDLGGDIAGGVVEEQA